MWPKRSAAPYRVDEREVLKPGHPRVVLRFADVDGRPTLVNVEIGVDVGLRLEQEGQHIEAPAPLAASATRLPLRQWTIEVLEERARLAERLAAGEILKQRPKEVWEPAARAAREDVEAFKRPPGRRPIPEREIAEAARVYAQAYSNSLPPTRAVAEHFRISRTAAAKRVAKARERGYLDPTEPRRAGGVRKESDGV